MRSFACLERFKFRDGPEWSVHPGTAPKNPVRKGTFMSWIFLLLAACAEIGFVLEMKLSDGFSRLGHAAASLFIMCLGVFVLSLAIRKIPVATAYAIWTGLGIVGTAVLEICFFGAPPSAAKLFCIFLILCGAAGLKLL